MSHKYFSKSQGETRGFYHKVNLFHKTKNSFENNKFYYDVATFLCNYGYAISDIQNESEDGYSKELNCSFHIDGTTVGLNATNIKKDKIPHWYANFVQLRIVSNGKLEDVERNISRSFPEFKRTPPSIKD